MSGAVLAASYARLQILAGEVLTRAGGARSSGGSRSSGRSSSRSSTSFRSSSGGRAGGGSIIGVLILFLILGVVGFVIWRAMKKRGITGSQLKEGFTAAQANWQSMSQGMQQAAAQPAAGGPQAGLDLIRAHDPGFDENAFLAEVQRSFFLVQQAWCECKPDLSRRVMGDALWQQHRVGIEAYIAKGQHNVLDNLVIGRADIVDAGSTQQQDHVTVRMVVSSSDYDVDNEKGKVVKGDKVERHWSEDWIFTRDSSATTKPGAGTLNQRCPNCGAPLDIDISGTCKYCKVIVMSGKYDWVLARISQVDIGNF